VLQSYNKLKVGGFLRHSVVVKRLVHRFGVPTETATSCRNCGIGKEAFPTSENWSV